MINLLTAKVSYLKSVESNMGESRTLKELLLSDEWKDQVLRVRNAESEEERKAAKRVLPCFTASGLFRNPINAKSLIEHSGFICIDIDAKDNDNVKDFAQLKERIHEIPYVAYCGHSVGGKGFFCLIPIKDPSKHTLYFKALQRDFKECGITIDRGCSDVSRKRIVSYDDAPYINTSAEVYDYVIPEQERICTRLKSLDDVDTRRKVEELLCTIKKGKTDITESREDWFEVLCAIASHYGEEGREYAHAFSQYYEGYTPEETNSKFDDVLRHEGYGYTIASLFYHANKVLNSAEYEFKDLLVYDYGL